MGPYLTFGELHSTHNSSNFTAINSKQNIRDLEALSVQTKLNS
jgi:hypothetical protein